MYTLSFSAFITDSKNILQVCLCTFIIKISSNPISSCQYPMQKLANGTNLCRKTSSNLDPVTKENIGFCFSRFYFEFTDSFASAVPRTSIFLLLIEIS